MAEIADADLPVFSFRVNWREGIAERLDWKTNVMADILGNEQRQGARLTPRREFEVTISVWDQERAFLDLWLHRMGGEFLFPLWHDSTRIALEAAQGDSAVWGDFRALEWEIGSYGLLRGVSALSFEKVRVLEVYDDHLVFEDPLAFDWPKGTRVEPLVRGRMTDQSRSSLKNERVAETQAIFETTRAQTYSEGVDSWDQYADLPVLAKQPNRTEQIDLEYLWRYSESDSETGRRYRYSDNDRAITQQKHAWLLHGRTAKREFRELLYRLRGQQGSFWLPTFNADLEMSRNLAAAAGSIYIKTIGYNYTGGATSGRDRICIQLKSGLRLYRRVLGLAASGNPAEERLVLDAPFVTGLQIGEVSRISWIDTARFQNDRIEFAHVNAADGATTVAAILQCFRNERVAPTVFASPIPLAEMMAGPCGEAPEGGDPCGPCQPCIPITIFSWDLSFNGCNPGYCPTRNWYMPVFGPPGYDYTVHPPIVPGGPTGVSLSGISIVNSCGADSSVYESNVYNDIGSPWYHSPAAINLQGQLLMHVTTTNSDFTITVHDAIIDGGGQLQIQYGPFWCGDFIATAHLVRTICAGCDCTCTPADLLGEVELVGNVPYTWVW